MTRHSLRACARLAAVATFLGVASVSAATLPVSSPLDRSAALIPGQYIVTLRKAPTGDALAGLPVASQASQLLTAVGGTSPFFVYEHALRGFAARMSPLQADLLRQHPLVQRVEQDQVMRAVASQGNATWGLDRLDQRTLPLNGSYGYPDQGGQGVHVYVIDTGLNASHSEFSGRVGNGRNFVGGGLLGLGGVDPNAWSDCHGHGTHVSGTAAGSTWGVAKKATVHAVRVLDCLGSGSTSAVIAGIDYVTQNQLRPAVANLSLGGGSSSSLDAAVRGAVNSGVTVAVAAGNDSADACSGSPNREPLAITVGATTASDARASYSNYGSCLDLFAPGSGIVSANYSSSSGSTSMSGTSMAAPHVAGAAALVLGAHPTYAPADVAARLLADASANVLSGIGSGSPNRLLYVAATSSNGSDAPPVARFDASCTALSCNFNGAASSDDRGIASYRWSFGDGSSGNGVSLSHSYAAAGSYSVTLTVTDSVGQTGTHTQTVTVGSSSGPCSDCSKVSGSLGNGATAYVPGSSGFSSGGGQFKGYLRGPAGADFDLYLEKLTSGVLGTSWSVVARGESTSNNEDVIYTGGAGTYRWRLKSYSGSGSYTFYYRNP